MGSESKRKEKLSNANKRRRILLLLLVIVSLCTGIGIYSSYSNTAATFFNDSSLKKDAAASSSPMSIDLQLKQFEHCSSSSSVITPSAPILNSEEPNNTLITIPTKIVWVSMAPFTISESFHKQLINPLTGTSAGAKSFYANRAGTLRECQGQDMTVTCLNVHPTVEMKKGKLDSLSNKFYSKTMMVLRNPMTSFPASYYAKSERYSGTVGQLPEENWRETRDEWFDNMMDGWKNTVVAWKETKKYEIGLYLVYEDLYDLTRGPLLMQNLKNFLMEAGFPIIDDSQCVWFNAVGEENLKRFSKLRFNYDDYIPKYTHSQKDQLLKMLKDLKERFTEDLRLVDILNRYMMEIRSSIQIE